LQFFITRWSNDTKEDQVKNYIEDFLKDNLIEIENVPIRTTNYKAFKITTSIKHKERMYNAASWPQGIV
jgi:hypothetical protein